MSFASGYHSLVALSHHRSAPPLFPAEQYPTRHRHCDVVRKASSSPALEFPTVTVRSVQANSPCSRRAAAYSYLSFDLLQASIQRHPSSPYLFFLSAFDASALGLAVKSSGRCTSSYSYSCSANHSPLVQFKEASISNQYFRGLPDLQHRHVGSTLRTSAQP